MVFVISTVVKHQHQMGRLRPGGVEDEDASAHGRVGDFQEARIFSFLNNISKLPATRGPPASKLNFEIIPLLILPTIFRMAMTRFYVIVVRCRIEDGVRHVVLRTLMLIGSLSCG